MRALSLQGLRDVPRTRPESIDKPLIDLGTPQAERLRSMGGKSPRNMIDAFSSMPVKKKSRMSSISGNESVISTELNVEDGTDELLNLDGQVGMLKHCSVCDLLTIIHTCPDKIWSRLTHGKLILDMRADSLFLCISFAAIFWGSTAHCDKTSCSHQKALIGKTTAKILKRDIQYEEQSLDQTWRAEAYPETPCFNLTNWFCLQVDARSPDLYGSAVKSTGLAFPAWALW